jgi:hypothetical protein
MSAGDEPGVAGVLALAERLATNPHVTWHSAFAQLHRALIAVVNAQPSAAHVGQRDGGAAGDDAATSCKGYDCGRDDCSTCTAMTAYYEQLDADPNDSAALRAAGDELAEAAEGVRSLASSDRIERFERAAQAWRSATEGDTP